MELYIEKEFLDNFYLEVDEKNLSTEQEIFISLLTEYGDKTVFMNYEVATLYDLENLKVENEYFALLCSGDKAPVEINSIKEHLLERKQFNQTIIFMNEEKQWFEEFEKKGVLCFAFDSYKEKIKKLKKLLSIKIDLTNGFVGWNLLRDYSLVPSNDISIRDNYILTNSDNNKIDKNLIPLLRNIMPVNSQGIKLDILTEELNPLIKGDYLKIKEKAKKAYIKIKKELKEYIFIHKIYSTKHSQNFKYHDRMIISNFYIIECGIGFNLMPSKNSDSMINGNSIFDKFYYDRIRNLKIRIEQHKQKLNFDENQDIFKYFPEHI